MKPEKVQRLDHIDALRGLAVLAVMALHTSYHSKPFYDGLNTVIVQGQNGVQLFYVISAFTLFLSLSLRKDLESGNIRNFFIRRFFRIAPLFYCAMVFYLWRDGLGPREFLGDAPAITPANILATATFTNGFNPYWINSVVPGGWSVAVEMLFYLFVPLAYKKISSLTSASIFTFVALLISTFFLVTGSRFVLISDRDLWTHFLDFWLPNQIPIFGLGFMLFFMMRRLQSALPTLQNKKSKAALLVGITIYLCLALPVGGFKFLPTHFLYGIAFVILVIGLTLHPFSFLVNTWTRYMGKISYSAYLTHFVVLPLIPIGLGWLAVKTGISLSAHLQYLVTFALLIVGTMVLATITYRFIELPGQDLGRRLIAAFEARKARQLPEPLDAAI